MQCVMDPEDKEDPSTTVKGMGSNSAVLGMLFLTAKELFMKFEVAPESNMIRACKGEVPKRS